MSSQYTAKNIAKYIISYCTKHNKSITNLKLQKMLYFVWIDYYKETNNFLFQDDFRAWQFGPVITEVYEDYCIFAGNEITREYDITLQDKFLDQAIENNMNKSTYDLVQQSHKKGHAWDQIYCNGDGCSKKIPYNLIISLECNE